MPVNKFYHPLPARGGGVVVAGGAPGPQGPPGRGFKVTQDGHYDMDKKLLTNVQTARADQHDHGANVHFVKQYLKRETGLEKKSEHVDKGRKRSLEHVEAQLPIKVAALTPDFPQQAVSQSYVDGLVPPIITVEGNIQAYNMNDKILRNVLEPKDGSDVVTSAFLTKKLNELPPAPTVTRGFRTETIDKKIHIRAQGSLHLASNPDPEDDEAVSKQYVIENLGIKSKNGKLEASKPLLLQEPSSFHSAEANSEAVTKKYVDDRILPKMSVLGPNTYDYYNANNRILRNVKDPINDNDVVTKSYLQKHAPTTTTATLPGLSSRTNDKQELEIVSTARLVLPKKTPIHETEAVSKEFTDSNYVKTKDNKNIINVGDAIVRGVRRAKEASDVVPLFQMNERIPLMKPKWGTEYYNMLNRQIKEVAHPTDDTDAVTKYFVDSLIRRDKNEIYLPPFRTLRLDSAPVSENHAISKKYVDDRIVLNDKFLTPAEGITLQVPKKKYTGDEDVINFHALRRQGPIKQTQRRLEDDEFGRKRSLTILSINDLIITGAENAVRMKDLIPYGQFLTDSITWNKKANKFEPFRARGLKEDFPKIGRVGDAQYADEVVNLKVLRQHMKPIQNDIKGAFVVIPTIITQYAYRENSGEYYKFYSGSYEYRFPRIFNESGLHSWHVYPEGCGEILISGLTHEYEPIDTVLTIRDFKLTENNTFKFKIDPEAGKEIVYMEIIIWLPRKVQYPPPQLVKPEDMEIDVPLAPVNDFDVPSDEKDEDIDSDVE